MLPFAKHEITKEMVSYTKMSPGKCSQDANYYQAYILWNRKDYYTLFQFLGWPDIAST